MASHFMSIICFAISILTPADVFKIAGMPVRIFRVNTVTNLISKCMCSPVLLCVCVLYKTSTNDAGGKCTIYLPVMKYLLDVASDQGLNWLSFI